MRKWIKKISQAVRLAAPVSPSNLIGNVVEGLETRQLCSSSLSYGINANSIKASNYDAVVKMLRDTGTKTVRSWISITSWSHSETGVFKYIRKFKADGFDVTATVVPKQRGGSEDTVSSYFNWLGDDLGGSVDRFQVGNEVDRSYGNLSGYVNNVLKPAYEGLHSAGEKVVSGSVSWNPDDIKTMVDDGMLNYCDYVGYHPYRNTVAQLKEAVAEVKDYANGKPLVATEWNVRGHEGNMSDWNEAIKEYWPTIRDNFYAAYYYAAIKSTSLAGPAGVITTSGGHNGAFYDTYKSLGDNFSGGGTISGDGGDDTTGGSTTNGSGNTAQSGTKPSIGSFRLLDEDGNTIKGYENVTAGETIKLSDLGDKKIQIKALTSSNAGSVKFSFSGKASRYENNAPYTAFVNSKGQESTWTATKGKYTLSATAYTKDNGAGTASATLSLVLNFI